MQTINELIKNSKSEVRVYALECTGDEIVATVTDGSKHFCESKEELVLNVIQVTMAKAQARRVLADAEAAGNAAVKIGSEARFPSPHLLVDGNRLATAFFGNVPLMTEAQADKVQAMRLETAKLNTEAYQAARQIESAYRQQNISVWSSLSRLWRGALIVARGDKGKYSTTKNSCDCIDNQKAGLVIDGEAVCKHMLATRIEAEIAPSVNKVVSNRLAAELEVIMKSAVARTDNRAINPSHTKRAWENRRRAADEMRARRRRSRKLQV